MHTRLHARAVEALRPANEACEQQQQWRAATGPEGHPGKGAPPQPGSPHQGPGAGWGRGDSSHDPSVDGSTNPPRHLACGCCNPWPPSTGTLAPRPRHHARQAPSVPTRCNAGPDTLENDAESVRSLDPVLFSCIDYRPARQERRQRRELCSCASAPKTPRTPRPRGGGGGGGGARPLLCYRCNDK